MKKPIAAAVICTLCAMAVSGFLYVAIFQLSGRGNGRVRHKGNWRRFIDHL